MNPTPDVGWLWLYDPDHPMVSKERLKRDTGRKQKQKFILNGNFANFMKKVVFGSILFIRILP